MSPERTTGDQAVGASTDTYALGSVLYVMLVGDPPYRGTTAQEVLGKIIAGKPVSTTKHRPSIPANVDAAVRKALEKLPADRFASAQDFVRALEDEHFRYGETLVASAAAGSPGPWKWASLVLTVIAILATTGWAVSSREQPRPLVRFEVSLNERRVLGTPNSGVDIAISPDGSRIVYRGPPAAGVQSASQLWERSMDGLVPLPITGTLGGQAPALSPDGMSVVFSGGGQPLRVKSLSGGPSTELVTGGSNATFGADGMLYYRMLGTGIVWRVPVAGGEAEAFTSEMEGVDLRYPDALPGGSGLLVTINRGDLLQSGIGVVGPEGGEVRELFAGAMARYAESGHIVYTAADGTLMAARFNLGSLEVTGAPIPMLEGVLVKATSASQFALSETGTLVYREGTASEIGGRQLVTIDLEGNEEALVLGPREIGAVSWSPDGQSVVYASEDQIYTYNVALGTTPRQLTFEGINARPVFSPDGTRIAFDSNRQGTDGGDLFVKNLVDDLPPRSIIPLDGNQLVTQWPSDALIVFERGENGNRDLWTVDFSDPDNPRAEDYLSSEADLRNMVVSPEGTLAAYASNESGRVEIYIRSFPEPGGLTMVSEGGGSWAFWSPDGNTLYYASPLGVVTAARIERDPVPVVVSRDSLFMVTPGIAPPFQGSGLHPDGDRFILSRNVGTTYAGPQRLILVQNFFEELKERVPN
jgi:Tol biopolymer transport system component